MRNVEKDIIEELKKDIIEELKNGDFSKIELDEWFLNQDFEYIFATIEGCDENLDFNTLYFISKYAQYLLKTPNAKVWGEDDLRSMIKSLRSSNPDSMSKEELVDYWNEVIIYKCELILREVAIVGSKHYEYFKPILEELYNIDNEYIRLQCCAKLDYSRFLNDSSTRVAKVAKIRDEFNKKWNSLDDKEKQKIEFLTSALEKGVIQCWDGNVIYEEEDKVCAVFTSLVFKYKERCPEFDYDIYYTISDKRVLADAINELIKVGKIILRDGFVPEYFQDTKNEQQAEEDNNSNLKLIHAFDMDFKNVLDYYNAFEENNYKDINSFAIRQVTEGKEKYYKWLLEYEKNMYYLVDSNNENYIIGFGSIEDSDILDYHLDYLNIGNIGYGVRPNERNKGYATKILELLLSKCEERGMKEVCVSCNKGNIASQQVILNNGGEFEKEFYDDFEGPGLKYWIKLNPKLSNRIRRLTNNIHNTK